MTTEEFQASTGVKPTPIGIVPKWRHDELRYIELCNAIGRYAEAGVPPDPEWIKEAWGLLEHYKGKKGWPNLQVGGVACENTEESNDDAY